MASTPADATAVPARRRRIAARTRLDFWFDAILLLGYTLAYGYGFTGIGIHEWLGLGLGLALVFHLTLHWDWVSRTTRKLVSPLTRIGPFWSQMHNTTAEVTLGLVPVHIALRWRWIVRIGRRLLAWRPR